MCFLHAQAWKFTCANTTSGQTCESTADVLQDLPELRKPVCLDGLCCFVNFSYRENIPVPGIIQLTHLLSPVLLEKGFERHHDPKYYALWDFSKQTRESKRELLEFLKFGQVMCVLSTTFEIALVF